MRRRTARDAPRPFADHSCDYDLDLEDTGGECTEACGSCDEDSGSCDGTNCNEGGGQSCDGTGSCDNTGGCDYSCDMACNAGPTSGCSASCDGAHAYEIYRRCDSQNNCGNNAGNMADPAQGEWMKYQPDAAAACATYGACRPRASHRSPLALHAIRVAQA